MTQPPAPDAAAVSSILLTEDDEGSRKLLATSLRRAGFDVIEASGGLEALALFEANAGRIRLLVTDVMMPELRGPELAAKLRAQNPRLPVVFITGYADRAGIHTDDLLMYKPFTPAAFVGAVKDILR